MRKTLMILLLLVLTTLFSCESNVSNDSTDKIELELLKDTGGDSTGNDDDKGQGPGGSGGG